jgi:hypothetical protein
MAFRPRNHWGNFLWGALHTLTIVDNPDPALQEHDAKRMFRHMTALIGVIPCLTCSAHYGEFVKSLEQEEKKYERMWLFERVVEFHNEVNAKLGKRIWMLERFHVFVSKDGTADRVFDDPSV